MLKCAKAKVDDILATESQQLREQKIHMIHMAMEALMYGAEKVSTTKHRQFQVQLNRARQLATTWSDDNPQKAIEQLESKIHQVTPAKCKFFDKLFDRQGRQLLQDVGTKATGPRSKLAKDLAQKKPATADQAYGVGNMTANKRLHF